MSGKEVGGGGAAHVPRHLFIPCVERGESVNRSDILLVSQPMVK